MIKTFMIFISMLILSSTANAYGLCAVGFQGPRQTGFSFAFQNGDYIAQLSDYSMTSSRSWNNKFSSFVVQPHCTLFAYQFDHFGHDRNLGNRIGFELVLSNSDHYPVEFNNLASYENKISSIICTCRF